MLGCGTGMGVLGCLGCWGAGAISVDLHMVLLFPRCWHTHARAQPSRTSATASQMPRDTRDSGGWGPTILPTVTWELPNVKRFIGTGCIFHVMEQVELWPEATWHFHRFLLLHPLFYSCPRPVAQGAACLCPPQ